MAIPPPGNNSDGSINPFSQCAGIGGIIRSSMETLLMGFVGKVMTTNALEAELHALLEGLEICKKLNLQHIITEGDCLTIVNSLEKYGKLSWSCMIIWKRVIQALMNVQLWEAEYCKR